MSLSDLANVATVASGIATVIGLSALLFAYWQYKADQQRELDRQLDEEKRKQESELFARQLVVDERLMKILTSMAKDRTEIIRNVFATPDTSYALRSLLATQLVRTTKAYISSFQLALDELKSLGVDVLMDKRVQYLIDLFSRSVSEDFEVLKYIQRRQESINKVLGEKEPKSIPEAQKALDDNLNFDHDRVAQTGISFLETTAEAQSMVERLQALQQAYFAGGTSGATPVAGTASRVSGGKKPT
jgi:hypothetical protein